MAGTTLIWIAFPPCRPEIPRPSNRLAWVGDAQVAMEGNDTLDHGGFVGDSA